LGGGIGLFTVCLADGENVGMHENYRRLPVLMDHQYQGKKEKIHELKYTDSLRNLYVLSIRFHKIFFVCEYHLWITVLMRLLAGILLLFRITALRHKNLD
jgi:hypothetical protein